MTGPIALVLGLVLLAAALATPLILRAWRDLSSPASTGDHDG